MKCFNHPEKDAVGICKNCNKGLCIECITSVENGIACTTTCVKEVELLNNLINRNKSSHNTTSSSYMRSAYLSGAMGLVFLIFGLKTEGLSSFLSIIGIIFIVGAVFSYSSARKFNQTKEN